MFIFTHVPRTGGTSFRFHFQNEIKKNIKVEVHKKYFLNKKYNLKNNVFYIQGHIPYGIHKCFNNINEKECKYITFLRDPIDRWISFFNLEMNRKKKYMKEKLWKQKAKQNIDKFLKICIEKEIHSNIIVKQLSGLEKNKDIKDKKGVWAYTWASREKKYTNNEMIKMMNKAENNLLNNYFFIGYVDNYQEDINRLYNIFGVKSFNIKNLYGRKGVKGKYDKYLKNNKLVYELNKYDIELYKRLHKKNK